MKLVVQDGEILCDHTLKAFVDALSAAHGHDRSVRVEIQRITTESAIFHIMTIDEEAELEAQP